jgi:hypothetical protein
MTWILAIDFGTTSTAAARRVAGRVEPIQLEGAPQMPSMVFWRQGTGASATGHLVLGTEADELSPAAPWCLERAPKSRLAAGDETMLLGDTELRVIEVIGQILHRVTDEALALSGGQRPAEVRLTHPARWQRTRLERLRAAAQSAGISDPVFVPEPVAAATHFASERLSEGDHVAVYDLGGGTLDTAVLRRVGDSFELAGRPGGDEGLGGENFDDLLYRYLGEQLPGETWQRLRHANDQRERVWAHANRQLLRDARRAKERLSSRPEAELFLGPPIDTELQVTAPEFEALISQSLRLSIGELERTILEAGLKPQDLAAVYLAGASSRIPLVTRLISERLGLVPERLDDPKAVTALGAARLPSAALETTPATPETPATPAASETLAAAPVPQETELAPTDPPAPPGGQEETVLEQKPPPPPPPPQPRPQPAGPGGPGRGGPGGPAGPRPDRAKAGDRRRAITIAIGSVLALGAAVGIAVVLLGGDGSSPPPPPPPPSDEELLTRSIDTRYRNSCETADREDRTRGYVASLECNVPPADSAYLESFPNLATVNNVYEDWANYNGRPLATTDTCTVKRWFQKLDWERANTIQGKIACTANEDDSYIVWTDIEHKSVGWVFTNGFTNSGLGSALDAWNNAVFGP